MLLRRSFSSSEPFTSDTCRKLSNTAKRFSSIISGIIANASVAPLRFIHIASERSIHIVGIRTNETYPSGRTITTDYDAANRPETTTGLLNTQPTNYITKTKYWPHGGIYYFTRGNGVWYAAAYNSRLQPVESYESVGNSASGFIGISCWNWGTQRPTDALIYNVCPAFDAAQNNGNLLGKAEYVGGPAAATALAGFGQNFSYDGVNRLTGVSDSGYTRNFGYDQWGNMWVSGYSVLAPAGNAPTANVYSNNQMNGTSYDLAGNQSVVNGNIAAYDAENHQVSVTEPPSLGGSTESYLYDGSGQRVQKSGARRHDDICI